jgi:hypothetical protein
MCVKLLSICSTGDNEAILAEIRSNHFAKVGLVINDDNADRICHDANLLLPRRIIKL